MTSPQSAPRLLIVIGANGAGKTTWTRDHRDRLPKPFYNADSIAEGLGDPNSTKLQAAARRIVDDAIDNDLRAHRSFGFESTYSGTSRPAVVRRAKALGYVVEAVFIGTSHHDINISRVQKRVCTASSKGFDICWRPARDDSGEYRRDGDGNTRTGEFRLQKLDSADRFKGYLQGEVCP